MATLTGVEQADSGNYVIQANEYDSAASFSVTYTAGAPYGFDVATSSISNTYPGSPGAYPSIFAGCQYGTLSENNPLPLVASGIAPGQVVTTCAATLIGTGTWDYVYDNWFNAGTFTTDNATNGLEHMIWLADRGATPPGSLYASGVTLGGNTFNIYWQSSWANASQGTASFQFTTQQTSVSIDMHDHITYMIEQGWLPVSWYLITVEAGFELWSGGAGLAITRFTVSNVPGAASFPQAPLDARADIDLDGTWTGITGYVLQREGESPPISITRGRADESAQVNAATAQFQLNNRDGRFSVKNATGIFYGLLGRNTPLRLSVPSQTPYLRLEGDQLSAAACADATALHITGDIDVRIDVQVTSYTESVLCSKWNTTATDGFAWALTMDSTGQLIWFWSTNGTGTNSATSSIPVPLGRQCFRVTMAVSTGTVTFYTGPTGGADGSTWTQFGSQVVSGSTSIYAATAQLAVGNNDPAGTADTGATGSYYEFELRSGIAGTVEAHPIFTAQAPGVTSFADAQANTWATSGTAEISGRSFRFHGELSSLPVTWDPTGTDVWVPVAAGGLLRRLGQGAAPLDSALKRALLSQTGTLAVVAYWPMEDLQGSTAIGSAIGGPLMNVTGGTGDGSITSTGPAFAADSGFLCSAALPTLNKAQFYGQVPRYTSNGSIIHRFLLKAGSTAPTSTTPLVRLITTGTCLSLEIRADTSWGLTFLGGNASGTVFTTGAQNFGLDYGASNIEGIQLWVSMELRPGSGSTVDCSMVVLRPGDDAGYYGSTTFTGTIGNVTEVYFNTGQQLTDTVVGHSSVQSDWESLFALADPLDAWQGELAGNRFTRLCGENGIAARIYGPPSTTVAMGAQAPDALTSLLQEIETADHGQLFEPRQTLALGYRPLAALVSQSPLVTIDYSAAELGGADLQPTYDDQFTRNDITAQRASGNVSGANYRYQLDDGSSMSISAPPGGVGDYADQVSVNVQTDTQLPDQAGWLVHVGTVDEARWPVLPLNMVRAEVAGIYWAILAADIGDYFEVINPLVQLPPDPIKQLVWGLKEDLGGFHFQIEWNGVPESPYEVELLNDAVYGTCDTDGSQLAEPATATATSITVATLDADSPAWTTSGGDVPFDIAVSGERMTVTAVTDESGSHTSPGTYTGLASIALDAGTWEIGWQVTLSGTLGTPEINNFQLSLGATYEASSVNPDVAGTYVQTPVTVTVPAGGATVELQSSGNAATTGAVYTATILTPQVFTVTRSVNGVAKAQTTGTAVSLWFPPTLAMV